ncbi:MAG TPA: ABC transporter permease, partial [Puia sp.]|nr:ABC transporter permease [Puia sp.]
TAVRNLLRNKVYSFINIAGLSLGLACCMLIFLYSKDEVSYDRFHKNKENIYRIVANMTNPQGITNKFSSTGMMPGPEFKRQIPEIEDYVRIKDASYTVKNGNNVFDQEALCVDDNFFSVFSFPLIQGDAKTALKNIRSLVLSEEEAEKYFGNKNAVGRTLDLKLNDTFRSFVVSAVTRRSPQNSSIKIKMLVPILSDKNMRDDNAWLNFYLNSFITLKPGVDKKSVEDKIANVYNKDAAAQIKDAAEKYGFKDRVRYGLQPLLEMHLSTDYQADNGLKDSSKPIYSYILIGIALFILLIACINFVNLTVARSLKRAKEIGIRKVVGGQRSQLITQFLSESFILCFMAFVLAVLLVQLALPFFNTLSNKALSFSYLLDTKLIAGFVVIFLVTGLLAGFYPAMVLSGFNPVQSLYGTQLVGGKNYLSKGLVVLQFTLALVLIIATITIYSQFNFLMEYDLGYNDKNVVALSTENIDRQKLEVLKTELLKNPSIESVSGDQGGRQGTMAHINGDHEMLFDIKNVDENYLSLFEIPVVKGRDFLKENISDSAKAVLVNETFAKEAGWKNPLGQTVDFYYNNKKYSVIGVVKDYHFLSLKEKIPSQLFIMNPQYSFRDIFIRLKSGNTAESINFIEKTFKQLFPFKVYQYSFKDEKNAEEYYSEAKWKQIISFGAVLTIFISCIGLFGLATLSAERRKKEIGIRKVLGSTVEAIVIKLSNDFLKLIIISALIASPAAWWAMHKWLENYPYRISMNIWMFAAAGLLVVLIALATVGFQAVKAAVANPADSLRTE